MNLMMLALTLIPIIAFVWLDAKAGPKQAIYGAIVLSFALLLVNIFVLKHLDWISFAEPVLFLILGYFSLKFNNTRFFKFQPFVLSVAFALVLFGYHWAGQPLLVKYLPVMKPLFDAEQWETISSPIMHEKLVKVGIAMGYTFIAHAFIMFYTAQKSSNTTWLLARIAIYPMMFASCILVFAL